MQHNEEEYQNIERVCDIARHTEKNILEGKEVFIDEIDRLFIKNIVEFSGEKRDLRLIRGAANLSQQAEDLVRVFSVQSLRNQGCDAIHGIISNVVHGTLDNDSGNVFGKGHRATEEEIASVSSFIASFFEGFYEKEFKISAEYSKGSWESKTMHRIEAVLAVTSKLLWILAADSEEEAKRRQNTPGVMKHLRERVLRGLEKEGKSVSKEVPRTNDDEIIRHLPEVGLAYILDALVRM